MLVLKDNCPFQIDKKHADVANKKIKIMPMVARNVFLELASSIDQVRRWPHRRVGHAAFVGGRGAAARYSDKI